MDCLSVGSLDVIDYFAWMFIYSPQGIIICRIESEQRFAVLLRFLIEQNGYLASTWLVHKSIVSWWAKLLFVGVSFSWERRVIDVTLITPLNRQQMKKTKNRKPGHRVMILICHVSHLIESKGSMQWIKIDVCVTQMTCLYSHQSLGKSQYNCRDLQWRLHTKGC